MPVSRDRHASCLAHAIRAALPSPSGGRGRGIAERERMPVLNFWLCNKDQDMRAIARARARAHAARTRHRRVRFRHRFPREPCRVRTRPARCARYAHAAVRPRVIAFLGIGQERGASAHTWCDYHPPAVARGERKKAEGERHTRVRHDACSSRSALAPQPPLEECSAAQSHHVRRRERVAVARGRHDGAERLGVMVFPVRPSNLTSCFF